ncbi:hypothetical protein [Xanthomonas sacchari]|uniref:hypothetical protein n=1 Tax=Xanthomonas sacchari TaxID=56458 RepID=UPI000AD55CAE|nr:hypothetical protein [Xanthomonas sacchari]
MSHGDAAAAADYATQLQRFAALHAGGDAQRLADNAHARIEVLQAGDLALPVTVGERHPGNAWVCSPRTTYADYAAEEAARLLPGALAAPVRGLCGGIGAWLDWARIDRAVTLNNWLLSTNLYPPLPPSGLRALLDAARTRWPDHALWFRSLNAVDTPQWLHALQAEGFTLIGSRQVYLYEDWPRLLRHRDLARDLKLVDRRDLQRCGNDAIGEADYARIAALYAQLYLEKYSHCNPAYHAGFLRAWHRAGLLRFDGFRDGDGNWSASPACSASAAPSPHRSSATTCTCRSGWRCTAPSPPAASTMRDGMASASTRAPARPVSSASAAACRSSSTARSMRATCRCGDASRSPRSAP